MGGSKPDRRVSRTKRRLKAALLELIETRPYEAISVRDITERADVGRSTFYAHYDSKEALLFAGFEDWLESLSAGVHGAHGRAASAFEGAAGRDGARFRFALPLLRHIATQPRFARATVARPGHARIQRRVRSILVQIVLSELAGRGDGAGRPADAADAAEAVEAVDREARAHAVVGALLGVVAWWLDGHERVAPEAVERVFQEVVAG